ncbi:hypothetical protein SAMN05421676_10782 [Salinibacillus kushneri]|uniref:Uncharacterized protein n=1 Tax=Salinibacillus kushneri TaxID=237682 RepID=A0A1I0GQ68_9BACI|nr:hypothetical protein [Salinibacillus kushneri]SET72429.1 hypothetical protein SAMN05421676_10782 [Salinibacillus kushneri]
MNDDLFQSYEIKERNGKLAITLELNSQLEEFSSELGVKDHHEGGDIQQEAADYIQSKFPKLEEGIVSVIANEIPLVTFPLNKNNSYQ